MTNPIYYLLLDQASRSDVPIIEVADDHLVARCERGHDDPLTVESLVLLPVSQRLVAEVSSTTSLTVYVVVLVAQTDTSPLLAHLTEPPARGVPCEFSAVRVDDLDGDDTPTITADQDETLLVKMGRSAYPVRSLTVLPTCKLVLVEALDDAGCLAVVAFELSDEAADTAPTVTLTLTSDQAAMVVDTLRLIGDFVQEAARAEPYYDLAALVGQQVAHQIGGAA